MGIPEYKPKFKDELLDIIQQMEKKVISLNIKEDYLDTAFICRPVLTTILSLCNSIYTIMIYRQKTAMDIILRSLSEYYVDFRFLLLSNNRELNSKFINYHKLIRYWNMDYIDSKELKCEFPEIIDQYNNYVGEKLIEDGEVNSNRLIKDKYKKHWSGLHFEVRIKKIIDNYIDGMLEVLNITDKKQIKHVRNIFLNADRDYDKKNYWKIIDKKITHIKIPNWQKLTINKKKDYINKLLLEIVFISLPLKTFRFDSNKTHLTPYVLPNFDPNKGSFTYNEYIADSVFDDIENHIFFIVDLSLDYYCRILPEGLGNSLRNEFYMYIDFNKNLKSHLMQIYMNRSS